jgi:hypothetical protein
VSVSVTAQTLVDVVRVCRFHYRDEDQLQQGLAAAFATTGLPVEREVRITPKDRLDFLVGRTAVEVKVAGQPESVLRQLQRYAASDRVDDLILITTRARHCSLPAVVGGKRLTVLRIGGVA